MTDAYSSSMQYIFDIKFKMGNVAPQWTFGPPDSIQVHVGSTLVYTLPTYFDPNLDIITVFLDITHPIHPPFLTWETN